MDSALYRHKKFIMILILLFSLNITNFVFAGTLLITQVKSNSVLLIDESTLKTIKVLPVGYKPHEVSVTPNGKFALVANFGNLSGKTPGETLTYIDILNKKVLQTIQLDKNSRPHGIYFLSDNEALVTAQGIQSLLLVDVVAGKVMKKLPLPGAGAHMVTVDKELKYAYVASVDSGTVCKIDLRNFSVIGEVKIGKEAEGIALSSDETLLLATDRLDNQVSVIRTKDLSILKKINTQCQPVRVQMENNGNNAVVINTVAGTAQVIDMASLAVIKTFATTTFPHSILPVPINIVMRDDQTAFISNAFANNISLINLTDGKVLNSIPVSLMPDGLALSPHSIMDAKDNCISEFRSGPIDINAKIEDVWKIVKNVEDYNRLSHGAITAHIDGQIASGKIINLILYKDQLIGKFIPQSNETVTIVDEDQKIVVWIRKLPDGEYTERYQQLEKISENMTRSTIILNIPGAIGVITKKTMGNLIDKAFEDLNAGIKSEAEKKA